MSRYGKENRAPFKVRNQAKQQQQSRELDDHEKPVEKAANMIEYEKQMAVFKQELVAKEKLVGALSGELCPMLHKISRYCLVNNKGSEARIYMDRMMDLCDKWKGVDLTQILMDMQSYLKDSTNACFCGKCGILGPKYKCGGCMKISYCSPNCQKTHWPEHKKKCEKRVVKPPPVVCANCKSEGPKFKCTGCREIDYCSAECQKTHWSEHKKLCAGAVKNVQPAKRREFDLAATKTEYDNHMKKLLDELAYKGKFMYGMTSGELCPLLFEISRYALMHDQPADEYAQRLFKLLNKWQCANPLDKYMELTIQHFDPALTACFCPTCGVCKPKYKSVKCERCLEVGYCSDACKTADLSEHKSKCTGKESEVPSCGLCGNTGKDRITLRKTSCCNKWICDDQHLYRLHSHSLISCTRNHERHSMCGKHYDECRKTGGKWQDCVKCSGPLEACGAENPKEVHEWKKFVVKYFEIGKVDNAIRRRNKLLKIDGSEALQCETSHITRPCGHPAIKKEWSKCPDF